MDQGDSCAPVEFRGGDRFARSRPTLGSENDVHYGNLDLSLSQMRFDVRYDDPSSLLSAYAVALHGLRSHGVIRSFNSPVGDIAEWIVSKKLQLTLTPISNRSYDAVDARGARYQIKARWRAGANQSKQLGALRDLASNPFEFLVAVIFDGDFIVDYAAVIPMEVVQQRSRYVARTNSHRMSFPRNVLSLPGVRDITPELQTWPPTAIEARMLAALAEARNDQ
jgi:hypothetical protein